MGLDDLFISARKEHIEHKKKMHRQMKNEQINKKNKKQSNKQKAQDYT